MRSIQFPLRLYLWYKKVERIPVHIIIDLLGAGDDKQTIKKTYPNITDDDIRACLAYVSILANEEAGVDQ